MRAVAADTLGVDGIFSDPLWREEVALTALEQELLRTWWVRRLGFIAHAGAASITSLQSYTRLEHSLGLMTLVAHFTPDDHLARLAALLHDIGHMPYSHTFEGVAGLDHHTLGAERIHQLAPILGRHGVAPEEVIEAVDGTRASGLRGLSGTSSALRLDHLESFIRSGRTHGRTTEPPSTTVGKLRVVRGTVDTDPVTAGYLADLAVGEARSQTSPANIASTGMMRALAGRLLDPATPDRRQQIAAMTDHEFWGLLLGDPATREDADLLRRDPAAFEVTALTPDQPTPTEAVVHTVRRLYLDVPLVDGRVSPPLVSSRYGLPVPPARYLITRD